MDRFLVLGPPCILIEFHCIASRSPPNLLRVEDHAANSVQYCTYFQSSSKNAVVCLSSSLFRNEALERQAQGVWRCGLRVPIRSICLRLFSR